MKIYKTYFDKTDTPFIAEFQQKKKYHTVWKRHAYKTFLGHKVIAVKLFGIFTLTDNQKEESPTRSFINLLKAELKEKENEIER